MSFLPVTPEEVKKRGWDAPDFVYVTGDAYVDHPSFGLAIISRVLEKAGWRVAMLPQPDWRSDEDFKRFGRPRVGFLVTAGVLDSMVNRYTVAKKPRGTDAYSPGGKTGMRPDRAVTVYCNRIRQAYPDTYIAIGGVEASLRRFAHYDYWEDKVRNSVLVDSGADVLMYGMGERSCRRVAQYLADGQDISAMRIPGTCVMAREVPDGFIRLPDAEEVMRDKRAFAEAFAAEEKEQDPVRGKPLAQKHGKRYLLQNVPDMPLTQQEMDETYALPYMRTWHPMYDKDGGIPGLAEVKFSIAHVRGCFGSCSFCSLTFHEGRIVTSRSRQSILDEAKLLIKDPEFKGYIHDVGGPTANFRQPACAKQLKQGTCADRKCLFPGVCPAVRTDESEYLDILRELRELRGVKKVFVRSGVRYDYALADKKSAFLSELVQHHISGQLKVAPEHVSDEVLRLMGKPRQSVFDEFAKRFDELNKKYGKDQYLVPYFMSSHPGCTLDDALTLALYIKKTGRHPEQVQDFYPTPGTLSTCMFYTGLDPRDMKSVYVPRNPHEKAMQRALMQFFRPENHALVLEALHRLGRDDLIGNGSDCLIPYRPYVHRKDAGEDKGARGTAKGRGARTEAGRSSSKDGRPAKGNGRRDGKPEGRNGRQDGRPDGRNGRQDRGYPKPEGRPAGRAGRPGGRDAGPGTGSGRKRGAAETDRDGRYGAGPRGDAGRTRKNTGDRTMRQTGGTGYGRNGHGTKGGRGHA